MCICISMCLYTPIRPLQTKAARLQPEVALYRPQVHFIVLPLHISVYLSIRLYIISISISVSVCVVRVTCVLF